MKTPVDRARRCRRAGAAARKYDMIDLSFSEMLLVAVVAIVVIGPKDLPRVMAQVGRWVGQGKAMVRQFRHGLDEMVRESELQEMEKRWAEHNQRIMAEHPDTLDHAPNNVDEDAAGAEMKPLSPPQQPTETPELPLDAPSSDTGEDKPQ